MSEARLIYELQDLLAQKATESDARHIPVLAKDIKGSNLVQVLSNMILSWPTADLRLEARYQDEHYVEPTDGEFMKDVARSMETRLRRKNMEQGMVWIDVLFQTNMAEFERYNLTVHQHNAEWREMGGRMDVFDPISGDIVDVKDNYVADAISSSKHAKIPLTFLEDTSTGPLAKARPKMKRSVGITIQYHVTLNIETFKLEYVAKDTRGRVLYFNIREDKDLMYLVRRSAQELWGNATLYGDEGPFLDGIAQLYLGRKATQCISSNTEPQYLDGAFKDVTIPLAASKVTRGAINFVIPILAYWVPLVLVLLSVWAAFVCMAASQYPGDEIERCNIFPVHLGHPGMSFVVIEIALLSLMWVCTATAGYLARKESALQIREKFI